ncbi:N-acetylglucosamine-6-phosphate deacetylase [Alteriqipengyuania lutimaris]|uniref:N-acetylglucosamine-6-phosphate deacetylase n=1 Tax=Alteriqipengyuania lutimaris TaxID=1538146 RepID=A0A395LH94_9SPHN|nr:N-acetylglucosamine-6-phosphate deacetylase [Alteriqipengyuania lutimaris]MBB3035423.1 N-acetylglucosamine-6-phosphate deacetylase [Alteriqipengyuania lutimaris]RDS75999.1 N-acetylglucosamine-6-phosphate deacetylase [Alteriqipengyuania lutimaris]
MSAHILSGAKIVTADGLRDGAAVAIENGLVREIGSGAKPSAKRVELEGGYLVPGFIDTQVNGGGGVLFNDAPTVETIDAIAQAHRRHGTSGLLPTLISDDFDTLRCGIEAVDAAIAAGVPGILGIHVEGPFISTERRGIHADRFVRAPMEAELELLARPSRGVKLVTLAPEAVPAGTIPRLRAAGVLVAAGHSTADYAATQRALDEGLDGFTHLFNAMTPFGSREPGMVGAALEDRKSRFGIIVDGHHVHPASLRVALAARGLDGAMLVTDAMPPAGTAMARFELQGRTIMVADAALRGDDGKLAGSALTMDLALRNAIGMLGLSLADASRLASANPASFLRMSARRGTIAPGMVADLVHLDDALRVRRVWIAGRLHDYG